MYKLHLRHFRTVLTILLALFMAAGAKANQGLESGDQAPDWILSNSRGEHISFYEDSAGQPAVLLFWASWCSNSAELIPAVEELRKEFADADIKFYALNMWEDGDPIAHMEEKGFELPVLLDADLVAKRYKVQGTPGLFVINSDKTVAYVRRSDASTSELYEAVKGALRR